MVLDDVSARRFVGIRELVELGSWRRKYVSAVCVANVEGICGAEVTRVLANRPISELYSCYST